MIKGTSMVQSILARTKGRYGSNFQISNRLLQRSKEGTFLLAPNKWKKKSNHETKQKEKTFLFRS